MNVEQFRQITRGEAVVVPNQAENQPLRSGNAELRSHALRSRLEPMRYGPEQTHEAENITQGLRFYTQPACLLVRTQAGASKRKMPRSGKRPSGSATVFVDDCQGDDQEGQQTQHVEVFRERTAQRE